LIMGGLHCRRDGEIVATGVVLPTLGAPGVSDAASSRADRQPAPQKAAHALAATAPRVNRVVRSHHPFVISLASSHNLPRRLSAKALAPTKHARPKLRRLTRLHDQGLEGSAR
jgi:hypothetical protein